MEIDVLMAALRKQNPKVPSGPARVWEHGQNNLVIAVGDGWVFRLARYADGARVLERECQWLSQLAPKLPLAIPVPQWSYFGGRDYPGGAYMGYPRIAGEPLLARRFHTLSAAAQEQVGQRLGQFLQTLHGLVLPDLDIPIGESGQWASFYEDVRDQVFPHLSVAAQRWVQGHFSEGLALLGDPTARGLIHGDFGTSNILYDSTEEDISGIIDFSSLSWDDPAVDIAALQASYGAEFLALLDYPNLETLLKRAEFYQGTFALQDALFGVTHGDHQALQAGIRSVEQEAV